MDIDTFGDLIPYLKDSNVTDINWNGKDLWIDDLTKGRYKASEKLETDFVTRLSAYVGNMTSQTINAYSPLLEAELPELRISILHEAVAKSGRTISIRKTPAIMRMRENQIVSTHYTEKKVLSFLRTAVELGMNIVIAGLPGAGKTELLKFLTNYIPANQRVITIEDTLEIHYRDLHPDKDCVEIKVTPQMSYADAIKASLRQKPYWLLLSEARSIEVKYLLESLSTGTRCITTIHTDSALKIPDRLRNMFPSGESAERITNDIYSFIDVGVLVKNQIGMNGITRYITEVVLFEREEERNLSIPIVLNRQLLPFMDSYPKRFSPLIEVLR